MQHDNAQLSSTLHASATMHRWHRAPNQSITDADRREEIETGKHLQDTNFVPGPWCKIDAGCIFSFPLY